MKKQQKIPMKEIIRLIERGSYFEATTSDGGFTVKINNYVPYCCTAIHNGSQLRPELQQKIALDEYERWYEEDPSTGSFIASMPITIIGNDSRYEYDLNRPSDECVYEVAWGKKVWKRKLLDTEIRQSKLKHEAYYKVLHALLSKLESMFGGCVVYDLHSYNYKRWKRDTPLFNIGTERIDNQRYADDIADWTQQLAAISLPSTTNETAVNDVFYGRGYNLTYITEHFKNTLVLATEIKKIYCDELTSDVYPKVIRNLQQGLKKAILNNANNFCQKLDQWNHLSKSKLLGQNIDPSLLKTDQTLHALVRDFELLATVNPVNTFLEKKRFFKHKHRIQPKFRYKPIKLNPFVLKRELSNLPMHSISDVSIRNLYEAVINSYFDKIDLISTIGTPKFLYNSLRYFGRPSEKDLQNAAFILHLPDIPGEGKREPSIGADKAMEIFRHQLVHYGIEASIKPSSKVISQVMVLNSEKSILFRPDAQFRNKELQALVEHEIGVHMVTTMNSNMQQLKVFNLGLPVNTLTQEGLAILAEYLSGNITLNRLRKLALRVVAVDLMCSGADFVECFAHLQENYNVDEDLAFNIVTRIYRGGGFTKDFLYLSGFVKILRFWENQHDLEPLLVGKTSLDFYHTIKEMIGRGMVAQPTYITHSFSAPKAENNNPIYNYIFSGLK